MVDFYPTLAELAGVTPPASLSGVSLVSTLKNADAQPRTSALTQYDSGYSVRTERYRYTEWGPGGSLGVELYDHQDDPQEMHNLGEKPESENVRKELSALLAQRIEDARQVPEGVTQIHFENRRRVP